MKHIDLTVLAPAYYPTMWPVRYLDRSSHHVGLPITWYGLHQPYPHWLAVQVHRLIPEVEAATTSHVLYTDASDVIALAPIDEVIEKYEYLGAPQLLLSVEPVDGRMCAGGWMGHKYAVLDALRWLADPTPWGGEDNPQNRWREALADGEIAGEVMLDERCDIFQVSGEAVRVVDGSMGKRLMNLREGSFPCLMHMAGGYSDPSIGKAAMIEPLWKELGYAPTV